MEEQPVGRGLAKPAGGPTRDGPAAAGRPRDASSTSPAPAGAASASEPGEAGAGPPTGSPSSPAVPSPASPAASASASPAASASASPAASPSAPPAPDARRTIGKRDTLRDRIVEHLRRTGTDSISGITRVLTEAGGAPAHRLTVAGYLQALADAGVVREMDRPPSKLYQLQNPEAHWSLHQRIHRILQDAGHGADAAGVRLALAALQLAFGRPIFAAELLHAGFPSVPEDLRRVVVGDATRRTYRELFTHRTSPHIVVPPRDPLLALDDGDPFLGSEEVEQLLRRVLVKSTGADHLVAERPAGPQQSQLDLGGAA